MMGNADIQDQIYDMLVNQRLTVKEISQRRKTSLAAVYEVIGKLKKKQRLPRGLKRGLENFEACQLKGLEKKAQWGYHALHFVIKPYYFFDRYKETQASVGNHSIPFGNWELFLNKESVEMQLKTGFRFTSSDKWASIEMARADFKEALENAADKYGFAVWKDKKANIRLVRQHLAYGESGLAKAVPENYIAIRAEDGHIWFMIDKSKGFKEHEYTHGETAVEDSEIYEPYINDMRYNRPPTNSQLSAAIMGNSNNIELSTMLQRNLIIMMAQNMGFVVDEKLNVIKPQQQEQPAPQEKPDYIL